VKVNARPAIHSAALADIAEVLPGFSTGTRLEHNESGSHQVVLSRHLVAGMPYRYGDQDAFRISPGRDARRYHLHAGDVLFMSRGTRNVASWIESVPERTIVPVSFFVIRPTPAVHPAYLTWFLNQPTTRRAVDDVRTGAGTPIVQRSALQRLRVPVPDVDVQETIAQLAAAMARERATLERLTAATARLHDLTSEQIARELLARAERNDDE
jgi:hypothetical protein